MNYTNGSFHANRSQSEAITHPPSPLMILAGAGTGKTTTILHRIVYMIEYYKIHPENILAITFTEKAANELLKRVIDIVGPKAETMTIGTFHSFCYGIVKDNYPVDHTPQVIMNDGDAVFLLLKIFDQLGPFKSTEFALDPVNSIVNGFLPYFDRIRDELINFDKVNFSILNSEAYPPEKINQLHDLIRIYPGFQTLKEENNFVDFGDMITACHDLLINSPTLLQAIRKTYRHIIVDEFQDNNFALNKIVGLIGGKHGSITVVGDDDQVIYSFRGASSYNIKVFKEKYQSYPNFKSISLEENFRSHQQILNIANKSISNNQGRELKTLSSFQKRSGSLPELWWGEKADQEQFIVEKIRELVKTNEYSYADIAILCRTRNQGKQIIRALQTNHIPVHSLRPDYFTLPVIKDIMSWCHIAAKGKHYESALFRVIKKEIGYKAASAIFQKLNRRNREFVLQQLPVFCPASYKQVLDRLIVQIKQIQSSANKKSAAEIVWDICVKRGLYKPFDKRSEYQDRVAILNLGDFNLRSQEFSQRHRSDHSIKHFVSYMDTMMQTNAVYTTLPVISRHSPVVLVQTIHGVKGGEFPVVFIPYNRSQSFPLTYKSKKIIDGPPDEWMNYYQSTNLTPKEHHLQEERRLFYVAITRAQNKLFLCAPKRATSPFIKELSSTLFNENQID